MQLRFKLLTPVLAMALIVAFSGTAMADITCTVKQQPLGRGTATGHTEVLGDIEFECVAGATGDIDSATMTVEIGIPITNEDGYPAAGIEIIGSGVLFPAGDAREPTITDVDNEGGNINIGLPGMSVAADDAGSFILTGVLASLVDASLDDPLSATLSLSADPDYDFDNNPSAVLLNNVEDGLDDIEVDSEATILADGTVTGDIAITITEGYFDMLQSAAQFNSGSSTADQGTQVLLEFNNIPDGVEIGGCAVTAFEGEAAGVGIVAASYGVDPTAVDADDNTITITVASQNTNATSSFTLTCGAGDIDVSDDALPLVGTDPITVRASLAPSGDALDDGDVFDDPDDGGEVPRYVESFGNEETVAEVEPATTTLLVNYAAVLGDYNTGISVANTTTDHLDAAGAQDGTITFYLFPTDGDMLEWETSDNAEVGSGSDDDGVVSSGNNFTVEVGEILADLEEEGDFIGYIFIETNFTHAHGYAAVYNNSNFSVTTQILILTDLDRGVVESLGN